MQSNIGFHGITIASTAVMVKIIIIAITLFVRKSIISIIIVIQICYIIHYFHLCQVVEVADICYRLSCNRAACANHGDLCRPWHYLLV